MRTHPPPPPDSDCIMQDVKLHLLNLQWFRDLGSSFSRFGVFVFEIWGRRSSVFVFECFVFETTLSMNRNIIFLPLKDAFRVIAKLVVLK